ncbi:hypothetical protein JCGZ_15203 [Jatropha curcas]|uniref:Aminotransferase-like plant mobile domain-containing protein n=1 Tax=Jatropha curcas TaxID=180498 RepID=A0A067K940_JATCU|nr:hypothetical protein JCGZ_15203 [Jatropha curcas]
MALLAASRSSNRADTSGARPCNGLHCLYGYAATVRKNKGDPAVLACLRDLGRVSSYAWGSLALAHLYHGLDVWTRGSGESNWQFLRPLEVWAYEYRIYPSGLGGDASADAWRISRYLAHRHHTFSSSEDSHYWRCSFNDRTLADVTPSDSLRGRCLGGLSCSCRGRGLYPIQDPAAGLLEASARCSSSPYVPAGGYDPGGPIGGVCASPADAHLTAGDYASYFTTRLQARLPEVQEYTQDRRRHRNPAYYRAQAEAEAEADALAGPIGAVLGDVPFPPGMEVALDPTLGLGSAIIIPADLRQAPPPLQLDPEHATHISRKNVPAQRYQELYQRFGFARSYIARLIWRLGGCGGTSPASPALLPDSRWRLIDSGPGWRWRGFLWISPRMRRMMMVAPRPMMRRHLHPLRQQLVPAEGDVNRPSPF